METQASINAREDRQAVRDRQYSEAMERARRDLQERTKDALARRTAAIQAAHDAYRAETEPALLDFRRYAAHLYDARFTE